MRLALTFALLAGLVYLALTSVFADSLHTEGTCPIQVWDQKTSPQTLWWKAVTSCDDHQAEGLSHDIRLQYFDWSDNTWKDDWGRFITTKFDLDFLADNRTWIVESWQGLFCYRVRGTHWIFEWTKFAYAEGETSSWGACY